MATKPRETEVRSTRQPVEEHGSRRIGGFAAVFDSRSQDLGGFTEIVSHVFFNKSRADGWPNVVARYNHSDEFLLGTAESGTLQLVVNEIGLAYDVELPEHRDDILELVRRKDLRHSSFAFQTHEDSWSYADGTPVRTLISGRLIDVSPVNRPAYSDSTVGLRSLATYLDEPLEDVMTKAKDHELRRFFIRTDLPAAKPISGYQAKLRLRARQAGGAESTMTPMQARKQLIHRRYPMTQPISAAAARAAVTRRRYSPAADGKVS